MAKILIVIILVSIEIAIIKHTYSLTLETALIELKNSSFLRVDFLELEILSCLCVAGSEVGLFS